MFGCIALVHSGVSLASPSIDVCDQIATVKYGDITDFSNFMGAVIDERAWDRLRKVVEEAAADSQTKVLSGAKADSSVGYFIAPTLYQTENMGSVLLHDELFGPIATVVVYEENAFDEIVNEIDGMSGYGLTGCIFASERRVINKAADELRYAAGNFYVNDKPTGAVVGQ
jgi:1-pyrroline-5-carboxylate dehydrogenase